MSGADIANLVKEAATIAMKRSMQMGQLTLVTMSDFLEVLPHIKPSISLRMKEEYERLKMDYDTLRAINPGIVYAFVNAYGTEGPDKDGPVSSSEETVEAPNPPPPVPAGRSWRPFLYIAAAVRWGRRAWRSSR